MNISDVVAVVVITVCIVVVILSVRNIVSDFRRQP